MIFSFLLQAFNTSNSCITICQRCILLCCIVLNCLVWPCNSFQYASFKYLAKKQDTKRWSASTSMLQKFNITLPVCFCKQFLQLLPSETMLDSPSPSPSTYKLVITHIRRQRRMFHILCRRKGPFSKQLLPEISHIGSKNFPFLPNVHLQMPAFVTIKRKILSGTALLKSCSWGHWKFKCWTELLSSENI